MTVLGSLYESSVSVYKTGTGYRVTSVVAEGDFLGNRAWRRVKVRRADADIPADIAQLTRRVWLRMLEDVGPAALDRPYRNGMRSIPVTALEYSLQRDGTLPLVGDLLLPAPGNKTAMLKSLSDLLSEYCNASASHRAGIARRIRSGAEALLAEKQGRRGGTRQDRSLPQGGITG
jgi:hypothetical protein